MGKIVQKTLLSCKRNHMTDAELNTNNYKYKFYFFKLFNNKRSEVKI
jgi:hypothetical protein